MFTFASVNDVCLLDFDGSTIASGHLDNNLRFWDARSGNCIKEVTGIHLGQITSVCPSSGKKRTILQPTVCYGQLVF